jgi:hypothetical protein
MGDTIDLLDETGAPVRESRQLSDPAAAAGDVLIVGADKTLSAAPIATTGGVTLYGPYALAYNTASLNDGVAVGYTPAIGDVFQVITIVTTAFNGTTPLVDYGYTGDTTGIIYAQTAAALDVSATALALTAYTVETVVDSSTSYSAWSVATAADGLLVWLSQNGQKGGTAPGGSAGAAKVYVLAATPVAF